VEIIKDALLNLGLGPQREEEWESGNLKRLQAKDRENLALARLFLKINTRSPYTFSGPPKSRLLSRKEIVKILRERGEYSKRKAGKKADEIIRRGYITFFWVSKGVTNVNIVAHHNDEGKTKYRFEAEFCCSIL